MSINLNNPTKRPHNASINSNFDDSNLTSNPSTRSSKSSTKSSTNKKVSTVSSSSSLSSSSRAPISSALTPLSQRFSALSINDSSSSNSSSFSSAPSSSLSNNSSFSSAPSSSSSNNSSFSLAPSSLFERSVSMNDTASDDFPSALFSEEEDESKEKEFEDLPDDETMSSNSMQDFWADIQGNFALANSELSKEKEKTMGQTPTSFSKEVENSPSSTPSITKKALSIGELLQAGRIKPKKTKRTQSKGKEEISKILNRHRAIMPVMTNEEIRKIQGFIDDAKEHLKRYDPKHARQYAILFFYKKALELDSFSPPESNFKTDPLLTHLKYSKEIFSALGEGDFNSAWKFSKDKTEFFRMLCSILKYREDGVPIKKAAIAWVKNNPKKIENFSRYKLFEEIVSFEECFKLSLMALLYAGFPDALLKARFLMNSSGNAKKASQHVYGHIRSTSVMDETLIQQPFSELGSRYKVIKNSLRVVFNADFGGFNIEEFKHWVSVQYTLLDNDLDDALEFCKNPELSLHFLQLIGEHIQTNPFMKSWMHHHLDTILKLGQSSPNCLRYTFLICASIGTDETLNAGCELIAKSFDIEHSFQFLQQLHRSQRLGCKFSKAVILRILQLGEKLANRCQNGDLTMGVAAKTRSSFQSILIWFDQANNKNKEEILSSPTIPFTSSLIQMESRDRIKVLYKMSSQIFTQPTALYKGSVISTSELIDALRSTLFNYPKLSALENIPSHIKLEELEQFFQNIFVEMSQNAPTYFNLDEVTDEKAVEAFFNNIVPFLKTSRMFLEREAVEKLTKQTFAQVTSLLKIYSSETAIKSVLRLVDFALELPEFEVDDYRPLFSELFFNCQAQDLTALSKILTDHYSKPNHSSLQSAIPHDQFIFSLLDLVLDHAVSVADQDLLEDIESIKNQNNNIECAKLAVGILRFIYKKDNEGGSAEFDFPSLEREKTENTRIECLARLLNHIHKNKQFYLDEFNQKDQIINFSQLIEIISPKLLCKLNKKIRAIYLSMAIDLGHDSTQRRILLGYHANLLVFKNLNDDDDLLNERKRGKVTSLDIKKRNETNDLQEDLALAISYSNVKNLFGFLRDVKHGCLSREFIDQQCIQVIVRAAKGECSDLEAISNFFEWFLRKKQEEYAELYKNYHIEEKYLAFRKAKFNQIEGKFLTAAGNLNKKLYDLVVKQRSLNEKQLAIFSDLKELAKGKYKQDIRNIERMFNYVARDLAYDLRVSALKERLNTISPRIIEIQRKIVHLLDDLYVKIRANGPPNLAKYDAQCQKDLHDCLNDLEGQESISESTRKFAFMWKYEKRLNEMITPTKIVSTLNEGGTIGLGEKEVENDLTIEYQERSYATAKNKVIQFWSPIWTPDLKASYVNLVYRHLQKDPNTLPRFCFMWQSDYHFFGSNEHIYLKMIFDQYASPDLKLYLIDASMKIMTPLLKPTQAFNLKMEFAEIYAPVDRLRYRMPDVLLTSQDSSSTLGLVSFEKRTPLSTYMSTLRHYLTSPLLKEFPKINLIILKNILIRLPSGQWGEFSKAMKNTLEYLLISQLFEYNPQVWEYFTDLLKDVLAQSRDRKFKKSIKKVLAEWPIRRESYLKFFGMNSDAKIHEEEKRAELTPYELYKQQHGNKPLEYSTSLSSLGQVMFDRVENELNEQIDSYYENEAMPEPTRQMESELTTSSSLSLTADPYLQQQMEKSRRLEEDIQKLLAQTSSYGFAPTLEPIQFQAVYKVSSELYKDDVAFPKPIWDKPQIEKHLVGNYSPEQYRQRQERFDRETEKDFIFFLNLVYHSSPEQLRQVQKAFEGVNKAHKEITKLFEKS